MVIYLCYYYYHCHYIVCVHWMCFKVMGSLVSVSMPQNGINAEGICALANAFSHNPNLEVSYES